MWVRSFWRPLRVHVSMAWAVMPSASLPATPMRTLPTSSATTFFAMLFT